MDAFWKGKEEFGNYKELATETAVTVESARMAQRISAEADLNTRRIEGVQ